MKRRITGHYKTMPGSSYYIRGGFELETANELGQVVETRVVGDGMHLQLFDGAGMLETAFVTSIIVSVSSLLI